MVFQLDLLIGETWARLHGLEPLPIRWKAPGAPTSRSNLGVQYIPPWVPRNFKHDLGGDMLVFRDVCWADINL